MPKVSGCWALSNSSRLLGNHSRILAAKQKTACSDEPGARVQTDDNRSRKRCKKPPVPGQEWIEGEATPAAEEARWRRTKRVSPKITAERQLRPGVVKAVDPTANTLTVTDRFGELTFPVAQG